MHEHMPDSAHKHTACLPSVPTAFPTPVGCSRQPGSHPWSAGRGQHPWMVKEKENYGERGVIHGMRVLGRKKTAIVQSRKKGKTGESRTPDSRE